MIASEFFLRFFLCRIYTKTVDNVTCVTELKGILSYNELVNNIISKGDSYEN